MLEVFAYKKYKKHKLEKQLREANAKEALDPQDEEFIRQSMDKASTQTSSASSLFKRFGKKKSRGDETKEGPPAVNEDTEGNYLFIVFGPADRDRNRDSRNAGS
jgi:hypothetical protein